MRKYSFLVPCFNEAKSLENLFEAFDCLWREFSHELIFVDDGSSDDTLKILENFASNCEFDCKIINLSRNFGKDRALMAGIQNCSDKNGLILMDADGQHTPDAVKALIHRMLEENVDIVFGRRTNREYESPIKRFFSKMTYGILNIGKRDGEKISGDIGDFFICSHLVTPALKMYKSHRPFWKGYYAYMGFKSDTVDIEIKARQHGQSKFNFFSLMFFALDGLTSHTTWILRFVSIIGAVVFSLTTILAIIIVIKYLITGETSEGFYTLFCLNAGLGGLTIMVIGILAEHLISTVRNDSGLPRYIIREIEVNKLKRK